MTVFPVDQEQHHLFASGCPQSRASFLSFVHQQVDHDYRIMRLHTAPGEKVTDGLLSIGDPHHTPPSCPAVTAMGMGMRRVIPLEKMVIAGMVWQRMQVLYPDGGSQYFLRPNATLAPNDRYYTSWSQLLRLRGQSNPVGRFPSVPSE